MSDQQLYKRLLKELIEAGQVRKANERLEFKVRTLEHRIEIAMRNCPVCSPKPGSPTLCNMCLMLRGSMDEDGYMTGPGR